MNKVLQRLLVFFLGIPLVIGLVFLPYYHELPLHLVVLFFSIAGCSELYNMFSKNSPLLPKYLLLALTGAIPIFAYICICCKLPLNYVSFAFIACILVLLGYNSFATKTFTHSNTAVSLSILIIFYTGYLASFISRMTAYEHAPFYIASFLFTIFICDSAAWLFGMLFGKNNRGIVAASPNKSIAGFIGGYAGCMVAAVLIHVLFPEIFPSTVWKQLLSGALIATAAIVGDLVESVFKRSAGIKDSGTIILGRGGALDSIDSILFAAPVFYLLLHILYGVQPL
ncbi:MAG: phosphatidate cytidylyltransferase [Treponema sp.]|nr:phosphatidate cytidylyltransferase [Treponema sp.]